MITYSVFICSPAILKRFFFFLIYTLGLTSLMAQTIKCLPTVRETRVWSLGREDPLEKALATHCSTLAWKIPWTEEPGRLQSMGLQRVGHNWATSLHFFTHGLKRREIRNSNNTKAYTVKGNLTREAQEYWSGSPIPSPADPLDPGIKPGSPTLQADSYICQS